MKAADAAPSAGLELAIVSTDPSLATRFGKTANKPEPVSTSLLMHFLVFKVLSSSVNKSSLGSTDVSSED